MAKKKESSEDKLVNLQAAQLASQVANFAAQLEFQKERFRLLELPEMQGRRQIDIDRLAFDKAQAAYDNAFKEAAVTGYYNGQPTMEYLTNVARMTGVLNGQQTLEGKLNDAQIAQINATIMNTQRGMDLEYMKYGTNVEQWDKEHQMALEKQQADLTGYINGLPTFEREQWQANQAQSYLNLVANLRGPENAFAQLKVLRQTPDALKQMAQSWAGQFSSQTYQGMGAPPPATVQSLAGGSIQGAPGQQLQQTSYAPEGTVQPGITTDQYTPIDNPMTAIQGGPNGNVPAYDPNAVADPNKMTVGTQLGTINDQGGYGTGAMTIAAYNPNAVASPGRMVPGNPRMMQEGRQPAYSTQPPGVPAPTHAYNYQKTVTGGTQVYPPGVQAPPGSMQVSTYQPVTQQTQSQMLAESDPNAGQGELVSPGQINAREYNKSTGYEKALGWANYEDKGWDKGVAQELFQRSLPKFGVSSNARGAVRI